MGKLSSILIVVIIIISGLFTLPACIDWLKARSGEVGPIEDLEQFEIVTFDKSYNITYNLDNGTLTENNPATYTLFTETFTLNNPSKEGYEFIGWTGTDISEPKLNVTICKGSAGDLEFTARYKLLLTAPTIRFEDDNQYLRIAWDSVEEATEYIVNVNGIDCQTTTSTFSNISVDNLRLGDNTLKVKASDGSVCGPYSNSLTYNIVNSLSAPTLTFKDNVFKFNKVDNAFYYRIIVGNCNFGFSADRSFSDHPAITYDDNYYYIDVGEALCNDDLCDLLFFGLENYSLINSTEHKAPFSVLAVPKFDTITASAESNKINYVYDVAFKFNNLNSTITTVTKTEMSNKYDMYDSAIGANLCVVLPFSFFTDESCSMIYLHANLKVELYKNDTLVTSCIGFKYTLGDVYHFKLEDIEMGETYSVKIMLNGVSESRNIIYLKDISFTYSSNTNLITYISLS